MSQLPTTDIQTQPDGAMPPGNSQATVPLMTGLGDPGASEEFSETDNWMGNDTANTNKLLGQSMILITVVAVIAAGSLYAMRLSQDNMATGQATKDAESKIADFLAKRDLLHSSDPRNPENVEKLLHDTDEIIDSISVGTAIQQVPVEFVKKNPFTILVMPQVSEELNPDAVLRKAMKNLQAELSRFELQTVMGGARNVAIINGDFYQEGDAIGSFTIQSISPDHQAIELMAEGHLFELNLE